MQIKELLDFISKTDFVGTMGFDPDTEGREVLRKKWQKCFGAGMIRGDTRQTSWGQ